MWVFTYKGDEDGFLTRCKARLVVRGDLQKNHSQDTYAATLATRVFKALMAIAAYFDLDIQQFDAVNAFCNAFLDEDVYIRYPDGFHVPDHCLQLIRALYGLPKSPLLWYNLMCEYLRKLGLSIIDPIINALNTPRTEPMEPLVPDARTVHLVAAMPSALAVGMPLFKELMSPNSWKGMKASAATTTSLASILPSVFPSTVA